MMGVLRKETILRKKMSVGGYGGFSDAMRCDDALLLACCGSDWLAMGLIEGELGGVGREGTIS